MDPLVEAVESGEAAAHADLAGMDAEHQQRVVEALLLSLDGRRWLRGDPDLSSERADRLLTFESDFRQRRRDRTLVEVVNRASAGSIGTHASAIAAGAAATALWRRLATEPAQLVKQASALVAGTDTQAAEATLHLLVLDQLDPFGVGTDGRLSIAEQALMSHAGEIRGLAAEFLAEYAPEVLERMLDHLVADESERVRGVVWSAALRINRQSTVERATKLLGDESATVSIRRSALNALGTSLPTAQMAEILSYFVVHPEHALAADAAGLLYRQHRNPLTAEAARDSPHADVREVAEQLLDPLRGSPAAGGSRPGDPTRSSADIFGDMIRQLEEKAGNQSSRS